MTKYLNEIEQFLAKVTGQQIFDRKIYYFDKIPTNVEASTVTLVNVGAVLIACMFSVLPAFRAVPIAAGAGTAVRVISTPGGEPAPRRVRVWLGPSHPVGVPR